MPSFWIWVTVNIQNNSVWTSNISGVHQLRVACGCHIRYSTALKHIMVDLRLEGVHHEHLSFCIMASFCVHLICFLSVPGHMHGYQLLCTPTLSFIIREEKTFFPLPVNHYSPKYSSSKNLWEELWLSPYQVTIWSGEVMIGLVCDRGGISVTALR